MKAVAKRPPDALVAKAAGALNNPIVSLQEMPGFEYIVDSELVSSGLIGSGQWEGVLEVRSSSSPLKVESNS
jgi:hypothetical protein